MNKTTTQKIGPWAAAILVFLLALWSVAVHEPEAASLRLEGKKIAIIVAFKQFKDQELTIPQTLFEQEGADVVIVSNRPGRARGTDGTEVEIKHLLKDLNVTDFEAVIFVGGPGAQEYWSDSTAHAVAREAVKQGKVLGAICWAPIILANAGVLEGKKATVFNRGPEAKLFTEHGALYTGEAVTVDGLIISANGPLAAEAFARVIIHALSE